MGSNDVQLAQNALRVLPGYKPTDFDHWFQSSFLNCRSYKSTTSDYAIVEFDLDKQHPISLPDEYAEFTDLINQHLSTCSAADPWGITDVDLVVLKLHDQPDSSAGRLLLFRQVFIASLLKKLFTKESITDAERRTLLQTLSGLNVKQAANQDSVSVETKRSHLKSVFAKTGIHGKQELSSFLISHLLLEVAAYQSRNPSRAESDQMFFDYVDQYMGTYVRASVIQESPTRRFRLIELGDPAGIPVICVHHLGILNFNEHEIAEIRRLGIRLICPLRHGAIGPLDERLTFEEHLEHAIAGIDLAASLIYGARITIFAMLSGSIYVNHYLHRYPDRANNVILLGASYKPKTVRPSASILKKNLHELASEHDEMLEATVSFLLDKVDEPAQLQRAMEETHHYCDSDIDVISELFADKQQVSAMQHRLKHSANSIVHDLRAQASCTWQPLVSNETAANVHFIHGASDQLIPINGIQELVSGKENYQLHVIDNAGNWMFGKHTPTAFSIVRDILAG